MRKVNYHTHTYRCKHADGNDEDYVIEAINNGYEELGFSDHCPWNYDSDYKSNMRMELKDFSEYKSSILALKEKYKDQISIKFGMEVEYFPRYMDWLKDFIVKEDLDYIIFGNHYYDTDEIRKYYGVQCASDLMLEKYVDGCIEGMKLGIYSYLAHPDLFMRCNRQFDEACILASKRICEASIKYDIPLEYNLEGASYNDYYDFMGYPHDKFWEIAGSYHCKAIIGVDAHDPSSLKTDKYRDQGLKKLEAFGLNIIDHIEFKRWEK